jgi:hypothetical protein
VELDAEIVVLVRKAAGSVGIVTGRDRHPRV